MCGGVPITDTDFARLQDSRKIHPLKLQGYVSLQQVDEGATCRNLDKIGNAHHAFHPITHITQKNPMLGIFDFMAQTMPSVR